MTKRNNRQVRGILLRLSNEGLISRQLIGKKFVYKVVA